MDGQMTCWCCIWLRHTASRFSPMQSKLCMWQIETRRQLGVAYNSVFRKIFGYRWFQSVSNLQAFLSGPTWEELVERRQNCFHARLFHNHDSLARLMLTWISFKIYLNLIYSSVYWLNLFMFCITVLLTCATPLCEYKPIINNIDEMKGIKKMCISDIPFINVVR